MIESQSITQLLASNRAEYNEAKLFFKSASYQYQKLYEWLQSGNPTSNAVGSWLRACDNKRGLVSGSGGGKRLANCAGARYRTLSFMGIPIDRRDGRKTSSLSDHGVHIEHTIPVNLRLKLLINSWRKGEITDLKAIENAVSDYQIGVAMTRFEERSVIKRGMNKSHPAITPEYSLSDIDRNALVFSRYESVAIYDMESGEKVDLSSFDFWKLVGTSR